MGSVQTLFYNSNWCVGVCICMYICVCSTNADHWWILHSVMVYYLMLMTSDFSLAVVMWVKLVMYEWISSAPVGVNAYVHNTHIFMIIYISPLLRSALTWPLMALFICSTTVYSDRGPVVNFICYSSTAAAGSVFCCKLYHNNTNADSSDLHSGVSGFASLADARLSWGFPWLYFFVTSANHAILKQTTLTFQSLSVHVTRSLSK
jgi:hypothetical protein